MIPLTEQPKMQPCSKTWRTHTISLQRGSMILFCLQRLSSFFFSFYCIINRHEKRKSMTYKSIILFSRNMLAYKKREKVRKQVDFTLQGITFRETTSQQLNKYQDEDIQKQLKFYLTEMQLRNHNVGNHLRTSLETEHPISKIPLKLYKHECQGTKARLWQGFSYHRMKTNSIICILFLLFLKTSFCGHHDHMHTSNRSWKLRLKDAAIMEIIERS